MARGQLPPHCVESGGNPTRKACPIGHVFRIGLLGKAPNMKNVPDWTCFSYGRAVGWRSCAAGEMNGFPLLVSKRSLEVNVGGRQEKMRGGGVAFMSKLISPGVKTRRNCLATSQGGVSTYKNGRNSSVPCTPVHSLSLWYFVCPSTLVLVVAPSHCLRCGVQWNPQRGCSEMGA